MSSWVRWALLEQLAQTEARSAPDEAQAASEDMSREVHLYRHFDAGGALLYVGVQRNLRAESSGIDTTRVWFGDVEKTTIETFSLVEMRQPPKARQTAMRNLNSISTHR